MFQYLQKKGKKVAILALCTPWQIGFETLILFFIDHLFGTFHLQKAGFIVGKYPEVKDGKKNEDTAMTAEGEERPGI